MLSFKSIKCIFLFWCLYGILFLGSCKKDTNVKTVSTKPDLNTYISYSIDGVNCVYSDTAYYSIFGLIDYDACTTLTLSTGDNLPIVGIHPGLGLVKNYSYPRMGLVLTIPNFSSLRNGDVRVTDTFSKYCAENSVYGRNLVGVFRKNNPTSIDPSRVDTTSYWYEAGVFINEPPFTNVYGSIEKIGDWKPQLGTVNIKYTKIEDFSWKANNGLAQKAKILTGEISGNFRKYHQRFVGKQNRLLQNVFLGNVVGSIKFRIIVSGF